MRFQWHNGGGHDKPEALAWPVPKRRCAHALQDASRYFVATGSAERLGVRARSAAFSGCGGFTLMELMVVILIISILTGVIVAEMHGTVQDAVLRATSRDLASAVSAVSSRSVAISRPMRLQLDPVNHRYFTERSTRGGTDFFPARDVLGGDGKLDGRITVAVLPPGVPLPVDTDVEPMTDAASQDEVLPPERASSVTFFPDGTAEARSIMLTDRDGYQMGLRVNPITSRVQILAMGHK